MWREDHLGADLLLHLGCVAMRQQPVGDGIGVDVGEHVGVGRRTAGAGDARQCVDHHARGLDQAGVDERAQRQRRGGDVAARRGNQPGALQLVAVQFGQPEHGLGEQFGLGVLEAVVGRVGGRILQPERRREIDDTADVTDQRRRELHRSAVREAEEDQIEPEQSLRVELAEHEVGIGDFERRVQVGGAAPGHRVARRQPDVELGVLRGQSQQLGAGEPRCPDDPDGDAGSRHLHEHTRTRMIMQPSVRNCGHEV